ncbi:MAG: carbonic anhydrase [Acidobacteriota bacterium]|nr:carbonic anhydrase [Acidobacteriota bacterium]
MSVIDEVVRANQEYARKHRVQHPSARPRRRLAVLTCMDSRLSKRTLGLETGDAHILRNAGGIVTEDALRSLLVSHYLLGTEEFMIINHTDCGLMGATEDEIRERILSRTGGASPVPASFHTFTDLYQNVRGQIEKVRSHPWVPKEVPVRGFVYDVATGRLHEVFV